MLEKIIKLGVVAFVGIIVGSLAIGLLNKIDNGTLGISGFSNTAPTYQNQMPMGNMQGNMPGMNYQGGYYNHGQMPGMNYQGQMPMGNMQGQMPGMNMGGNAGMNMNMSGNDPMNMGGNGGMNMNMSGGGGMNMNMNAGNQQGGMGMGMGMGMMDMDKQMNMM